MFIKCVLEFALCKGKGSAFYKPTIMGDFPERPLVDELAPHLA